jgi:hypothetical protein
LLTACSTSVSGTGPDVLDSGSDAPAGDGRAGDAAADVGFEGGADTGHEAEAGTCAGLMCNGQCVSLTDCRSCQGKPLLCGATRECVDSCQACADTSGTALPVECFACDVMHQNPIGTCQYQDAGSYCLNGDYAGQYQGGAGYRCQCSDVSMCPGATQICVPLGNVGASFCLTCGEATTGMAQGMACQGGGTCHVAQAACL